jgi:hypothetical protein
VPATELKDGAPYNRADQHRECVAAGHDADDYLRPEGAEGRVGMAARMNRGARRRSCRRLTRLAGRIDIAILFRAVPGASGTGMLAAVVSLRIGAMSRSR